MLYGIRRTAVSVRAGSARAPCAVCISQLRCFIEPQPLICWRRSTHVLAILRDSPSRKIVFISSSPIEKNLRFKSILAVVRIYAAFSGGLGVKTKLYDVFFKQQVLLFKKKKLYDVFINSKFYSLFITFE